MTWKEEEEDDRVIPLQGKHNNQIYKGEGNTLEVNREEVEIQDHDVSQKGKGTKARCHYYYFFMKTS
jgi:hypothetical protein